MSDRTRHLPTNSMSNAAYVVKSMHISKCDSVHDYVKESFIVEKSIANETGLQKLDANSC